MNEEYGKESATITPMHATAVKYAYINKADGQRAQLVFEGEHGVSSPGLETEPGEVSALNATTTKIPNNFNQTPRNIDAMQRTEMVDPHGNMTSGLTGTDQGVMKPRNIGLYVGSKTFVNDTQRAKFKEMMTSS